MCINSGLLNSTDMSPIGNKTAYQEVKCVHNYEAIERYVNEAVMDSY